MKPLGRILWLPVFAAVATFLMVYPLVVGPYLLHLTVGILLAMVLAIAWDLLARTGQVSVGQAGLFGIGAYTAALLHTRAGVAPLASILLGILAAVMVAILLGAVCLRMRGIYFSIATLSFAEALQVLALMNRPLTGGSMGVSLPPLFGGERAGAYYLVLGLAVLAVATAVAVGRSRLHYAFTALRENEDVAGVIGINQTAYKIAAFAISAAFTGAAGGFYAFYITFIDPATTFSLGLSLSAMVMPIFGGLYTVAGPVIGTVLLKAVEEYLRAAVGSGNQIVYGLVLVLVTLFLPRGLVGLWQDRVGRRYFSTRAGRAETAG